MLFFVENVKVQITSRKHLQEMVWYLSPGQMLKEEKYSRSTIQKISLIFSQIMILMKIVEKMNKMIPYNQVTNHFLGKLC